MRHWNSVWRWHSLRYRIHIGMGSRKRKARQPLAKTHHQQKPTTALPISSTCFLPLQSSR